jgi:hypothetical protein
MLVNKCYLKDIRDFEDEQHINVLSLFEKLSVENLVLILSILYRNKKVEELYDEIDKYIDEGHSLNDLFIELRNVVLGYDVEEAEKKQKNIDANEIAGTYEDITSYKTLTEFYTHLCMQLMSLGMSYSEFWSLTTREMYQTFEAIQQKMVMDYNREMQIWHNGAAMIGGAVWGKLPDKAPSIDIEELRNPDELIDTEEGQMTREEYRIYKKLNNM